MSIETIALIISIILTSIILASQDNNPFHE